MNEVARLEEEQQRGLNPFQTPVRGGGDTGGNAMVAVESSRAVAEMQTAMLIAKRFPRDPVQAMDRILQAFTRPTLAEKAEYGYARGGTEISGPSIRAAESIAQLWGNIHFGVRELSQSNGVSEVEAFAWDVETGTKQVKLFQVPHVRYSKSAGNTRLTDPRDIYEMVANQGARRLRACVLGVIPGDVVEAAMNQADLTMKTKAEVTPERLKALLEKFAEFGVTQAQIEQRIQRRLDAMTPALMVQLGKIYNALKDGIAKVSDHFDVAPQGDGGKQTLRSRAGVTTEPTKEPAPAAQAVAQDAQKPEPTQPPPETAKAAPAASQGADAPKLVPAIPYEDVLKMAKKAKSREQGEIVLDAMRDPAYTDEQRADVKTILDSKDYNKQGA